MVLLVEVVDRLALKQVELVVQKEAEEVGHLILLKEELVVLLVEVVDRLALK